MHGRMPQKSNHTSVGGLPFERLAEKYDAWFYSDQGCRIFAVEVFCIQRLLEDMPHPWLEVGVGTGQFAAALGVDDGIDLSPNVLKYAARRGVTVRRSNAEDLPYGDHQFGVVLMVVTICFLDNPARAFKECSRVLRHDGYAIVGFVPKDSKWGEKYAREGAVGHPFYSSARFYTTQSVIDLAKQAGFTLEKASSCLFESPEQQVDQYELPAAGIHEGAGFVALRFAQVNA